MLISETMSPLCSVKYGYLKRVLISACFFVLGTMAGFCAQVTYTVTSGSTVSTSGTAPEGSSAAYSNSVGYETQITNGTTVTLTLSNYGVVCITNITFSMHSNQASGSGKLKYSIDGGTTWTNLIGPSGVAFNDARWYGSWSEQYVDVSKDVRIVSQSGQNIVIQIEGTINSLYCRSFTITYVTDTYTVSFSPEGGTCETESLTEESVGGGVELPEAVPSAEAEAIGWTFAGWKRSSAQTETSTEPTLYEAGDTYLPENDEMLYAVYKLSEALPGCTEEKISTTAGLSVGDYVIMTYDKSATKYQYDGHNVSNYGNSTTYSSASPPPVHLLEVKSGSLSEQYAFFDIEDSVCLAYTYGKKDDALYTTLTVTTNSSWTVTIANGDADIRNAVTTTRYLRYNGTNQRFACYTSGKNAVQLYRYCPPYISYCSDPEVVWDTFRDGMHENAATEKCGLHYTMPSVPSDAVDGVTDCDADHAHCIGWINETNVNEDGTIDAANEAYIIPSEDINSGDGYRADGTTYYAVWVEYGDINPRAWCAPARDATVREWGANSLVVAADMTDVAGVSVQVEGGAATAASLCAVNAASLTDAKYVRIDAGEATLCAAANWGKGLYLHWLNNSGDEIARSKVMIPCVVTADATMSNISTDKATWASREVHLLPGATLTADAGSFDDDAVTIATLYVYPGATLSVTSGTLTTATLRLRNGWTRAGAKQYTSARVYIAAFAALVKTTASIDYDIFDAGEGRHYYPLSVPFPTPVSSIDYADATLAYWSDYGAGGQYIIKTYDGDARARSGVSSSNWVALKADATLQPGVGYIVTAVDVQGEAILRVPLDFDNAWTAAGEKASIIVDAVTTNKAQVSLSAYSGTAAEANPCHGGWNMLGVPYMSCYQFSEDEVPYVTMPTHDFARYIQLEAEEAALLPGWSFFVQVGVNADLTFAQLSQQAGSDQPVLTQQRTLDSTLTRIKTGVILRSADGNSSDKFGLILSDRYSSAYEIGADLEKMFGEAYTLAAYTLSQGTRLAFNALSMAEASRPIPVGYRAPEAGQYTFALNPRYATTGLLRVELIDYQTGTVTNLLETAYTFTTSRTQDDTRFALRVICSETPTSVEELLMPTDDAHAVRKMMLNGRLYIRHQDKVYDATGTETRF